jgi:polyisoprenyl-phosphate glycosyltransferase
MESKMKYKHVDISVIIPCFNEEEILLDLCKALESLFLKLEISAEVIFVNDGSSDNSMDVFSDFTFTNYKAKLISLSKNFGSHAALRAGMLHASGDFISFMNADLQDPLDLIPKLYAQCKKGNSIVWAFRNSSENTFFERLFSNAYSSLMKKYAIANYPDKGFDVVMFDKKLLLNLNTNIEANSSVHLQILTLGYAQASIGYDKLKRTKGKSKWTVSKKIKLLIDSFVSFSYFPIRLVSITGFTFFVLGLFWTIYIVSRKLFLDDLSSGWPALVSILMLGFGITNISLGIIAEYLWRTLDASRKRPVFIIDDIIELTENE